MPRTLYCFILVLFLSIQSLHAQVNRKDTNKAYPDAKKGTVVQKQAGDIEEILYADMGEYLELLEMDIAAMKNGMIQSVEGMSESEKEDMNRAAFDCVLECFYRMERSLNYYYDKYQVLGLLYDIDSPELGKELQLLSREVKESEIFDEDACGCANEHNY